MATTTTPTAAAAAAGDKEPTDPAQLKADMQKCPRWILAKLQSERKARSELETQLKTLLPELDKYNAELETWKAKLALLEASELGDKDMAAVTQEKLAQLQQLEEQLAQSELQINNKQKLLQKRNDEVNNFKGIIKEMQETKKVSTVQVKEAIEKKDNELRKKQEEIERLKSDLARYGNFLKTRVTSQLPFSPSPAPSPITS
eukprot:TRINITY_DN1677_c1_g1_i2.p1 TRINITY_DN1677_c1_g1~~TRINITY_DN1677_c1_g1_i2.p1  ORF type:complete len:202 (-),score=84.09 TRINITY_DN1677_c1_g1_i2:143-748(-)